GGGARCARRRHRSPGCGRALLPRGGGRPPRRPTGWERTSAASPRSGVATRSRSRRAAPIRPACGTRAAPAGRWLALASTDEPPDRVRKGAGGEAGSACAGRSPKGAAWSSAHERTSPRFGPGGKRRRHRGAHRRKARAPLSTESGPGRDELAETTVTGAPTSRKTWNLRRNYLRSPATTTAGPFVAKAPAGVLAPSATAPAFARAREAPPPAARRASRGPWPGQRATPRGTAPRSAAAARRPSRGRAG